MSAYRPTDSALTVLLAVALAANVVAGLGISRLRNVILARFLGWTLFGAGVVGVERFTATQPPGVRMIALIAWGLLAMKAVVLVEAQAAGAARLSLGRQALFTLAWIGMNPRAFATRDPAGAPEARRLLLLGARNLGIGVALLVLARLLASRTHSPVLVTALALPGLSFVVHFGAITLLAAFWRGRGFDCDAQFVAPLRAQSLSEFWGRRWNLAFSEMTAIAVYRPLSSRFGRRTGVAASFLLSGLLHEMVISIPVRAGYGAPLAYFALHGGLVLYEHERVRAGRALRGWPGRAWALFWLAAPVAVLFHPPFLHGVVWPLFGAP